MKEGNLYFAKESYQLIGCAYNVFNKLKYGYHERNYQKAYALELQDKGINFSKELRVNIIYGDKKVGRYFIDFLVENKIVIELKVANDFHFSHIKQVLSYLKVKNIKLGLLILFTSQGIKFKRIVN